MIIREMRKEDAANVSEIGIKSKATWGYSLEVMEIFAGELTLTGEDISSCYDAKVAVEKGDIVGYYTLRLRQNGTLALEHLFVHPEYFHKGVGSALLRSALATASEKGADAISIIADPNSAGFYVRRGAVVVGEHHSSISGRIIPVLSLRTSTRGEPQRD